MIDSTVNQTQYTANSGSWNTQISALQAFSSSQQPSFTALNAFTASQLDINDGVNTFTQSANDRLGDLEQASASLQSFTASINQIQDEGTVLGYSTRFNFRGDLISASVTPNVSGLITNVDVISDTTKVNVTTFNSYTASADSKFNSFTASTDQRLDSIESNTGSYVDLAADNVFTGDTNTFNNDVNILGTLTAVSASFQYTTSSVVVVGQNKILLNTNTPATRFGGISVQDSGSVGNPSGSLFWDSLNDRWIYQHPSGSTEGYNSAILLAGPANSGSLGNEQTLTAGKIPVATGEDHLDNSIITQAGSQINVAGAVSASNGFIAGGNTTNTIGEGSNIRFLSGSDYYNVQLVPGVGDLAFSRSGTGNVKVMTLAGVAGNNTTFQNNPVVFNDTVSSLTVNAQSTAISGSGSYSLQASAITQAAPTATTTASSSFIGTVSITGQSGADGKVFLLGHSGSLVLGNSTTNAYYDALSYISSSVSNANTNLIFKTNTNTTGVIVSGSANLFVPPSAPTAEFKRYIGGSGNIALLAAVIPQITGSNQISPSFTNNIFQGNSMFMRTPVSSSTWTISGNSFNNFGNIAFGTAQATSFVSASAGVQISNNFVGGTLNATAYKTTLYGPVGIIQSYFGGTLTMNNDSSSITFVNSAMQGALTINNSYNSSTTTNANGLAINAGCLFMGTTNNIYASGSNTTTTQNRQIVSSAIIGMSNSASVNLNGDNAQLNSVALIGHSLVVTGSSAIYTTAVTGSDRGTAIVGRFNAPVQSGNTVFVVGAGTTNSTRKNAILVDSGSNVFVEGSLSVSGSFALNGGATPLAFTGSTVMTGSLTITGSTYGNVFSASVSSGTASLDMSKANYFTLTLPSSSVTNINVTNFTAGQTAICLVLNAGQYASASFNNKTKQPAGFAYSGSSYGVSQGYDVLTFTSFTANDVFLTSVTQFQ
jgi:hypothetical protein